MRTRLAGVVTLVSILALAACTLAAPPQKETAMDHIEAKAELERLLEIAQTSVGGEWHSSDTGARSCNGGEGASYLLSRDGQAVATSDQPAVIDAVVAGWAAAGVDAVITTKPEVNDVVVTQLRYPESGTVDGGFFIEVWISDRASTATGQTRCAAGDAAEINAG